MPAGYSRLLLFVCKVLYSIFSTLENVKGSYHALHYRSYSWPSISAMKRLLFLSIALCFFWLGIFLLVDWFCIFQFNISINQNIQLSECIRQLCTAIRKIQIKPKWAIQSQFNCEPPTPCSWVSRTFFSSKLCKYQEHKPLRSQINKTLAVITTNIK